MLSFKPVIIKRAIPILYFSYAEDDSKPGWIYVNLNKKALRISQKFHEDRFSKGQIVTDVVKFKEIEGFIYGTETTTFNKYTASTRKLMAKGQYELPWYDWECISFILKDGLTVDIAI